MALLHVNNLKVCFTLPDTEIYAVDGVHFVLEQGQTLGIVGESGSGKSQTVLAMLGLLANNGRASGAVLYQGTNLLSAPLSLLNALRGNRIAMIFQDPMTALNPYLTIERQMTEVLEWHSKMSRRAAVRRAIELLEKVHIPDAAQRIHCFPHQFSGGMRQRVMIAMALLCNPAILIADEPTTALDVTVQAQILALLRELQHEFATAIIMITHDLGVVAGLCDDVMVMYGGRVMEKGSAEQIFYHPSHPYTRGLLATLPRLDQEVAELVSIPGSPPVLTALPKGCPFHERCRFVIETCRLQPPLLQPIPAYPAGQRACHRRVEELEDIS
jgi:oligopeptide transport system ATP-binding protein